MDTPGSSISNLLGISRQLRYHLSNFTQWLFRVSLRRSQGWHASPGLRSFLAASPSDLLPRACEKLKASRWLCHILQEGTLPLQSGKTLRGGRGGVALLLGTLPLQAQFSPPVFKWICSFECWSLDGSRELGSETFAIIPVPSGAELLQLQMPLFVHTPWRSSLTPLPSTSFAFSPSAPLHFHWGVTLAQLRCPEIPSAKLINPLL